MDKVEVRVKRPKDIFRDFLASKGLKSTCQRHIILDAFYASEHHLSAEDLFTKLRVTHPNIGYTTVYRTLRLLIEAGVARVIKLIDGQTRYEQVRRGDRHDHLVCSRCNTVIDFHNETLDKLHREIASLYGFQIDTHRLYGLCASCRD